MGLRVRIPTPLQAMTDNQAEVEAQGETVREMLSDLDARFPGIRERICDDEGKLRRFVNVYVNDEDVRFLGGEDTKLKEGDRVSIIPAIAGGVSR